jgi:hypothetical protein
MQQAIRPLSNASIFVT